MNRNDYKHAFKTLKNKRKEFEDKIKELKCEIEFVDEELRILDKDFINRNAKFNESDIVSFLTKEYKVYNIYIEIDSISIVYDIGNIHKKLYNIYEQNLKLEKRCNND